VAQLGQSLKGMEQEVEMLKELIGKIATENATLGKENDMKDKQYRSLQEHLVKISSVDSSTYPPSEEAWKLIVVENKTYSEICDCMKTDIKNLKVNEKKLLDLIDILRTQGYPVDEVYQKLVFPKFSKKRENKEKKFKKLEIGSEEEENLISSPQKNPKIPASIPLLNFNKLIPTLQPSSPSKQSSSINSI